MFVRELPPDRGMLFLFEFPQEVAFWMKDTVLSLDLIFIDPAGKVLNVAANAKPYSLDPIESAGPGPCRPGGRRRHGPDHWPQARRHDHPPVFANDRDPGLDLAQSPAGESDSALTTIGRHAGHFRVRKWKSNGPKTARSGHKVGITASPNA